MDPFTNLIPVSCSEMNKPFTTNPQNGLIFDIQGYSVHDGPGCRTLVFMSGCPLSCPWCANPEGQLLQPRLMYRHNICIQHHFRCITACPHGAVSKTGSLPTLAFDRTRCEPCDQMVCVNACLSEALQVSGKIYSIDSIMKTLHRDQGYWGDHGGVTFTGGEPLMQADFLTGVLKKCRSAYIHTAVETSGYTSRSNLLAMLKWTDWLFVDLKHMDPERHRQYTGVSNSLILKNLAAIASSGWKGRLILRVTVVPGFNDTDDNMVKTARFAKATGLTEINLLPFHRLGESKYEQLGIPYSYQSHPSPEKKALTTYQQIFETNGLTCYVDSETPF